MKIHVLSDLHLEFEAFDLPNVGADVLILAGDTSPGKKGVEWIKSLNLGIPVIYIMGNHEYYGFAFPKLLFDLKQMCMDTNIHILENESLIIDGITFLGCTLWSDFRLYGQPVAAELAAQFGMSDYRLIRRSPRYSKLHPADTAAEFRSSVFWLQKQLEMKNEKAVVITHHAPSARSIPENFKDSELNPAFASNLDDLIMDFQPVCWIHGHTHQALNYHIGKSNIICNPRGYPGEPDHGFDPLKIIEI
ncbi:MAG: metallophosphoesterase [Bacteroidales bacterium]|nr:metallophosphoesterase [Bacteroidales bacterium]